MEIEPPPIPPKNIVLVLYFFAVTCSSAIFLSFGIGMLAADQSLMYACLNIMK